MNEPKGRVFIPGKPLQPSMIEYSCLLGPLVSGKEISVVNTVPHLRYKYHNILYPIMQPKVLLTTHKILD